MSKKSLVSEQQRQPTFNDIVAINFSQIDAVTLDYASQLYLVAVKPILSAAGHKVGVANFTQRLVPQSSQESLIDRSLVIMPCKLAGTAWTEEELITAMHIQCIPLSMRESETVIAAIPENIWQAGVLSLERLSEENYLKNMLESVLSLLR